jgi:hypothetical protein
MFMLATVAALAIGLTVARAEEKEKTPDATLRLSGGSVAAGIGVNWGGGTLSYKGKEYPVDVKGLSVGDVGVAKIEASGKVYNLKSLEDFDGNYTAAAGGVTAAGGASAAVMKNQSGVTVELVSTTQGVKVTIGAAGVDMKIKK